MPIIQKCKLVNFWIFTETKALLDLENKSWERQILFSNKSHKNFKDFDR